MNCVKQKGFAPACTHPFGSQCENKKRVRLPSGAEANACLCRCHFSVHPACYVLEGPPIPDGAEEVQWLKDYARDMNLGWAIR